MFSPLLSITLSFSSIFHCSALPPLTSVPFQISETSNSFLNRMLNRDTITRITYKSKWKNIILLTIWHKIQIGFQIKSIVLTFCKWLNHISLFRHYSQYQVYLHQRNYISITVRSEGSCQYRKLEILLCLCLSWHLEVVLTHEEHEKINDRGMLCIHVSRTADSFTIHYIVNIT